MRSHKRHLLLTHGAAASSSSAFSFTPTISVHGAPVTHAHPNYGESPRTNVASARDLVTTAGEVAGRRGMQLVLVFHSNTGVTGCSWGSCRRQGGGESRRRARFGAWTDDVVDELVAASNEALQTSIARRHARPTLLIIDAALCPFALQIKNMEFDANLSEKDAEPANTASLADIAASILKSTSGMQLQKWTIADLTLGLYFLSVRHASQMAGDTFSGDLVSSDAFVGDLIYYVELAQGSYQKDAAGLARVSMIQESKVVKFEDTSNVMRPGYYIAIDARHKLVILCIRGTHTVHDIVTDLASSSECASMVDGECVHYGSVEAARWFLEHEMSTLKNCLEEHKGYELRLVGHSLGGSTAALLALMLKRSGREDLGISPSSIRAVTIASPPCVSKKLASECADYITTLVLQDDVIPRMNTAALTRLRNEILVTNWTLLKDEDSKSLAELVETTIKKFSSVQDVARRYASFVSQSSSSDPEEGEKLEKNVEEVAKKLLEKKEKSAEPALSKGEPKPRELESKPEEKHPELWVPGLLLLICGGQAPTNEDGTKSAGREGHVLLKGQDGTQFGRIVLSSTMLSDHKCISIYYALRDVLKGLPKTGGSDKLSI